MQKTMTHYKSDVKIEAENCPRKNGFLTNIIVASVLFSLVLAYFVATNAIVAQNFKLLSFQKIVKEKQSRNQELQNLALQNYSLKGLGERAKTLNLVSVSQVKYIKVSNDYFALAPAR